MNPQTQSHKTSAPTAFTVPVNKITETAAEHGINAGMVTQMQVEPSKNLFGLGIAPTKLTDDQWQVQFQLGGHIANQQTLQGAYFYECTADVAAFDGISQVADQIGSFIDAETGKPAHSVYGFSPAISGRLAQCALPRRKGEKPRVLNPIGKFGVSSIRFAPNMGVVIGLLLDPTGKCVDIGLLPATSAQANLDKLDQHKTWRVRLGKQESRDILELSKEHESLDGKTIKFIAHLAGGYQRLLVVQKRDTGEYATHWGAPQEMGAQQAVGYVNGQHDVMAFSEPRPGAAVITFKTTKQLEQAGNTAAKDYLN